MDHRILLFNFDPNTLSNFGLNGFDTILLNYYKPLEGNKIENQEKSVLLMSIINIKEI